MLYAAQAITLWVLPRFRPLAQPQSQARQRRRQWLATIGVDLLAFTLLHVLDVGQLVQLCRPAGAAGADGRRADLAPAGPGHGGGGGPDAVAGGLARGAGQPRSRGPDDAVGAGGHGPVRDHAAGRRAGGSPGARGTRRARQPGGGAPAGAAQPPRDRGDGRRRAGGRSPRCACVPPTRRRVRCSSIRAWARRRRSRLHGAAGLGRAAAGCRAGDGRRRLARWSAAT